MKQLTSQIKTILPRLDVVSALDLHLRYEILRFCRRVSSRRHERFDDGLAHGSRNIPGWSTEVEVALLSTEVVVDDLRVLGDAVLYVDLVLLVTGEGGAEHAENALAARVVFLELVAVRELRRPVASAEEERHRADRLAAGLRHFTVLHHGAERRDTGSKSDHNTGQDVRFGYGNPSPVDFRRDQIDGRAVATQCLQVVGAQADVVLARGRRPVVLDDAQLQDVAVHLRGRRDRV